MTLGEYSSPAYQKKLQQGKYMIVCTSQPGANMDTFDKKKLQGNVLCRVRNILESGLVDFVILATSHHPKCPDAEQTVFISDETAGLSEPDSFPTAPTVLATLELWGHKNYLDQIILLADDRATSREELMENAVLRVPKKAKIISKVWLGDSVPEAISK